MNTKKFDYKIGDMFKSKQSGVILELIEIDKHQQCKFKYDNGTIYWICEYTIKKYMERITDSNDELEIMY